MKHRLVALGAALVLILSTLSAGGTAALAASSSSSGGALNVVVVGNEFLNLDPAHDENDVTDENQMNSIYGGLFYQTAKGGIGLGMASGYKFTDDEKKLTITIRPGIKFTDGTPLTAAVVAWNINRDLLPANACDCANSFEEVTSTKAVGDTVVMTTKIPDVPLVQAFIDNAPDWPASETAVKKAIASSGSDAAFGQHPVGAGPFMVSSFVPNSKVVLVKNANYYIKGEPSLSSISFSTTPVDQSAYSALQSNTAQIVLGLQTVPLIKQAESSEKVITVPGAIDITLEINTTKAPFNNLKAREAVASAIDAQQLLSTNSPGFGQTVESDIGPASKYYQATVPGHVGYNLTRAKQLVKQIGGLSFNLQTLPTATDSLLASSIENELSSAGIKISITPDPQTTIDNDMMSGNWESETGASGGIDPDIGAQSLPTRFSSQGVYTCCKSPALDTLINQSIETSGPQRTTIFHKIDAMVAKDVDYIPLYALPSAVLYSSSVKNITAAAGQSPGTVFMDWATMTMS